MKRRGFLGFLGGLLGLSVVKPEAEADHFPLAETCGTRLVDWSALNCTVSVYQDGQWKTYFNGKLYDTDTPNWTTL